MAETRSRPAGSRRLTSYDELGARRHHVISERLRERRRELGLTQKEVVARLRRMGVATTNKALSALEHGAGLDVAKLPEMARALDCTLTYLVGLTDDPAAWEPEFGQWPGRRPRLAEALAPRPRTGLDVPARSAASTEEVPGCPPILAPLR